MTGERPPALALLAAAGFSFGPCVSGVPGRAMVFTAIDPGGIPCAVKVLDPALPPTPLTAARFAAERVHHAKAAGCVNVVPLHGAIHDDDRVLCLRWAQRGSLDQVLESGVAPEATRCRQLVAALAAACAALHARGLVHRDIKPSNILLHGDTIWLADFGLAAHLDVAGRWRSLPEPWREEEIGTPGWVAPELAGTECITGPTNDIYSLACVWRRLGAAESSADVRLLAAMLDPEPAARPTAMEVQAALTPA